MQAGNHRRVVNQSSCAVDAPPAQHGQCEARLAARPFQQRVMAAGKHQRSGGAALLIAFEMVHQPKVDRLAGEQELSRHPYTGHFALPDQVINLPFLQSQVGRDLRCRQVFGCAHHIADSLLVHDAVGEEAMVRDGFATERRDVMYNDYVIVGPGGDPAGIRHAENAAEAFNRIARAEAVFVSRGDHSGTHRAELRVWQQAGVEPRGRWYRELGSGMGATLTTAAAMLIGRASGAAIVALFGGAIFAWSTTAAANPEFKIRGRFNLDYAVHEEDNIPLDDGFLFRRTRIGVGGTINENWSGIIEYDFAENSTNNIPFVERSSANAALVDARRLGVGYDFYAGALGLQGMVYGRSFGADQPGDDPIGIALRSIYAPRFGDNQLHVAASVTYEDARDFDARRFRDRPEARISTAGMPRAAGSSQAKGARTATRFSGA